jgi:hypothetical protein
LIGRQLECWLALAEQLVLYIDEVPIYLEIRHALNGVHKTIVLYTVFCAEGVEIGVLFGESKIYTTSLIDSTLNSQIALLRRTEGWPRSKRLAEEISLWALCGSFKIPWETDVLAQHRAGFYISGWNLYWLRLLFQVPISIANFEKNKICKICVLSLCSCSKTTFRWSKYLLHWKKCQKFPMSTGIELSYPLGK